MDWIRENKSQATILGIFGAIALALGVMLFLSSSDYGASLEELQSATSKLSAKEKASLYPNQANVDALEEKVSGYEEKVGLLSKTLLILQGKAPEDIADTAFQAKLKQSINELREKVKSSTGLPKDFAFGFETYTISLPRSPEAAKELNDYFESVKAVVTAAVDAGVQSIDHINRTELAIEKGAPPAPRVVQQPKAAPKKSPKKGKGGKAAPPPPPPVTQVVERRTLTLKLTADQGSLQLFLNALASPSKMPYFTVVRSLRVENEKQEGPLKSNIPPPQIEKKEPPKKEEPTKNSDGTPAAPKLEVIVPPTPSERDAMTIMGGEKLHVYLEIDLVRFVEPTS